MPIDNQYKSIFSGLLLISVCLLCGSCRKMIAIDEPINSITSTEVFATDAQASSAMAGVYTLMINGGTAQAFASGNISALTGMSSDELNYYTTDIGYTPFVNNKLTADAYGSYAIWQSAYTTIYRANAVIEGIGASVSTRLHDSVRTGLTGESKFVRALCYFYLTNLFGDVPLALTIDFSKTQNLPKAPQKQVYQQIVKDLQDAIAVLPETYLPLNGAAARVRPNKWAATALLARVDLFLGDYNGAASLASSVIGKSGLYDLEPDLNQVFLTGSHEAIWQLQQNAGNAYSGSATMEGMMYLPNPLNTGLAAYTMTSQLLAAFEPDDARRAAWVGSTDNTSSGSQPAHTTYYPFKYKTGYYNRVQDANAVPTEYYMVLRLAEQYLIRAEAEANGAPGGSAAAIADLNIVRDRAGLPPLSSSLSSGQVIAAVAHERQIEFFGEWGHRWLDLKRTGKAHDVLSQLPAKQPWTGDYQLLYPIPPGEIRSDHNLVQNPGYLN